MPRFLRPSQVKILEGATVEINTVVAVIGGSAPALNAEPGVPLASQPIAVLAAPSEVVDAGRKLRSSPLVRRIARENSLNLTLVPGTGSEGRITKDDILRHLSQHGPGSKPKPAAPAPAAPAASPSSLPGQVVPMTKMRAIIADRMVESVRISPHAHIVYKVDMTRVVKLRERAKARFEQQNGVKLTYMPFIAAAAIDTLRRFPIVNSSLINGNIHYHLHVDLGIAVALEWGLIVPVVRAAEARTFPALAFAINDLAARARIKKLLPDEASGSTFTLTNAGVFGGEFGTPILNQPESGILAIGGLKKEPVVRTDADGSDTIAIRSMQNFCLGFDHRTIDGADAGRFMAEFKKALETWDKEIG